MKLTPPFTADAPRLARSIHVRTARAAFAAAILLGTAHVAGAQIPARNTASAAQPAAWEFRVSSGALVPTGVQRDVLDDAALTVAQLSFVVRPSLAITGSFGWARSHDLVSAGTPKVDVFTYDLGAEARSRQWGRPLTLSAFAGAGAGGRSYNHRDLEVDATRHISAYLAAGGEIGIRRVHLRAELRDYVGGFTPLAGGGRRHTRNDVVLMAGLRISRRTARATATSPQHRADAPVVDSLRPSIVIESPAPDSTVGGPAIIVFRTENIRIMSVFAPEDADAGSAPGGHLHVKVDSGAWHWVHSSVDPVVVSGLPPGKHTVRLELADRNHRPLDVKTVTFTIAAPHIH
jgi:hypothetical protein